VDEQFFFNSIKSGFIDKKFSPSTAFHPKLLINDQSSEQRVLTTIERALNQCQEFWFSVAFITTSGVASIISTLKTLEDKGVYGKILASEYQNFTQPEALRRLMQLSNVELKISVNRNFHSKGYLFKIDGNYDLIIGSSNLTANALSRNVEWNLKVSAKPESMLMHDALQEFEAEFEKGDVVDDFFLTDYEASYLAAKQIRSGLLFKKYQEFVTDPLDPNTRSIMDVGLSKIIEPNSMQKEALENLRLIREKGLTKALLVSATGTGKTYLSAFDAHSFDAKRLLFVVHRKNIAKAALDSFEQIFRNERTMGLYSGESKQIACEFIFCTIQTLSRPENLNQFKQDHFDYIIIDESHRAGGNTYQNIINYFEPKFLLGMTATPERTDGFDIFELYDHTIAYEIRLHQALAEDMLSPFHYYGITDLTIDGRSIDESSDFNLLTSEERVDRILEQASFYGTDTGQIRSLVFCSRVEECISLAEVFRLKGKRAIALTGMNSEEERSDAILRLEADDIDDTHPKLDYIFTVDIFNEGIDIPRINQVIMLRPTQSAIIFVQQMGRGLRKTEGKEYLTIIDFIGNYANNYLVPIALYGDNSYNKDRLRKLIKGGSSPIPGTSTVNFDEISKGRIFSAIDKANMRLLRDLKNDYELLKFQLGRPPMMLDFLESNSRDPYLYIEYSDSFFAFSESQEESLRGVISDKDKKLLGFFSKEINNAKRIEEPLILGALIEKEVVNLEEISLQIQSKYAYQNLEFIESAINNLNLKFVTGRLNNKTVPLDQIFNVRIVQQTGYELRLHPEFVIILQNPHFKEYLLDSITYAIRTFDKTYDANKFKQGFLLYQKYSRKDVFRILCWETNPIAQNVGGYIISRDQSNCPIFVTYHKEDSISESIKYEDYFLDHSTFAWMSKSKRKLSSPDVQSIRNHEALGLRMPLFIKKTDDEGKDFYYVGDVQPMDDSFKQGTMKTDKGKTVSVVQLVFKLDNPVEDGIYEYLSQVCIPVIPATHSV